MKTFSGPNPPRIALIGECMIELQQRADGGVDSQGLRPGSVAVEHLHQVIAELALDWPVDHAQWLLENHRIDGADHLPGPYFAEVAAALAGRAGRVFLGQHIERLALGDTLLELFGLIGGFHQNMAGLSFHSDSYPGTVVAAGRDYA